MEYAGDAFHTFLDLDSAIYLAVNGTVTSLPVFIQNILNCVLKTNACFTHAPSTVRLQSVCVTYASAEAARTHFAFTQDTLSLSDPLLPTIIIIKPHVVSLYWKCFFSIVILFYQDTVTQSFIDIFTFKLN